MCPVDNHAQEGIQYLPIMHLDIEFQVLKHSYMYAHVEVHSYVCFKTSSGSNELCQVDRPKKGLNIFHLHDIEFHQNKSTAVVYNALNQMNYQTR